MDKKQLYVEVAQAARVLDKIDSEWAEMIDTEALDMTNYCIIHQVFPKEYFARVLNRCRVNGYTGHDAFGHPDTKELWVKEIKSRLKAAV